MEIDTKNRFDGKRPFDVIRAEDFGEDLYEFYNPIEKLIRKVSGVEITGSRPVFIIGGRGTGKTMVLKFQDFDMQLKDYIFNVLKLGSGKKMLTCEEMTKFVSAKKFLGVYLRFKTIEYDSMQGDLSTFFEPYLSMKVTQHLFKILKCLKDCNLLSIKNEIKIAEYFASQIKEPNVGKINSIEGVIDAIEKTIIPLFEIIEMKYAYYTLEEIKREYRIPLILYDKIFFGLPNLIFEEVAILRGKKLFVLFDELEYLDDFKASCIGSLIKNSDETVVIFKIGSRYMRNSLQVGQSSEVLQEPHDFRIIDITGALNKAHSGRKDDYSKLIKDILNRRLEKSEFFKSRGIYKVEQLFPSYPISQEAKDLVRGRKKHWDRFEENLKKDVSQKRIKQVIEQLSYPENPIIEKLNMLLYHRGNPPEKIRAMMNEYNQRNNDEYADLYEKNEFNLLFQLYNDYGANKIYAGLDVFINLSSGIIRNAIEICNQALNTAYNYGYEKQENKAIDIQHQDIGAKLESKLQYEDIQRIPGSHLKVCKGIDSATSLGMEVQDFVNQIGTVFRSLELDPDIVEPEQTHFETDYLSLDNYSRDVIDTAVRFSYLQEKPGMKPKDVRDTKKRDLVLNRIFAPYFLISYRVRGRTYISAKQIQSLICAEDELNKKAIRSQIISQNTRKRRRTKETGIQKKLFETKG